MFKCKISKYQKFIFFLLRPSKPYQRQNSGSDKSLNEELVLLSDGSQIELELTMGK